MSDPRPQWSPEARDQQLATDYRTPPHVLDEVARKPVVRWQDGHRTVFESAREQVTVHPEVSPDTLAWLLSVSVDEAVVCNALRHENTPVADLRRFVHSPVPQHWNALAQNTGAGDAFVYEVVVAHLDRPQVALCALINPATGDMAFERIAEHLGDEWSEVIKGIRKSRTDRW